MQRIFSLHIRSLRLWSSPRMLGLLVLLSMGASLVHTAHAQTGWINEFHYDNDGTDVDEFVEIVMATDGPIDLPALEIILYNGSTGEPYRSTTGLDLIAGATTDHYAVYAWYPSDMQNGHDGIALGYAGRLLDFVSYEGTFAGTTGLAAGATTEDVGIEEATNTSIGYSIQRIGAGGSAGDFTWTGPITASAGLVNTGQTLASVPLELTTSEQLVVTGDTLSVSVLVGSSAHPVTDLVGAGLQIRYDPTFLSYLTYGLGSFLSTDLLVFELDDPTTGVLAFSLTEKAPTVGSSGTGAIVTFDFAVSGTILSDTTVRLQPEEILATDLSGAAIPLAPLGTDVTLSTGPALGLPVDTLDFGLVDVSVGAETVIYIHNPGGLPLDVTEIATDRTDFLPGAAPIQVLPGDSQAVTVQFAPSTAGTITGSLTFSSTDAETPVQSLVVTGIAAPFVWPGDTDNDGAVDVIDVLPLGQHFGRKGPQRGFGLAWLARLADAWNLLDATYADATGDGVVDQNDLQPIGFNYGRSRTAAKAPSIAFETSHASPTNGFAEVRTDSPIAETSLWAQALGDTIPLTVGISSQLVNEPWLGLAAVLEYDSGSLSLIDVQPDSSFDDGTLLELVRHDRSRGILAFAYTRRRTGRPMPGAGPGVHLSFEAVGGSPAPAPVRLLRSALGTTAHLHRGVRLDLESRLPVSSPRSADLPSGFRLIGAYPNPFNPTARIRFDLPDRSEISISVYDVLGRRMASLGPFLLDAGYDRTIPIEASNWAAGTYIYNIRVRGREGAGTSHVDTGRMTLLK